ncbi:gamma-tubulin complex component 4-like [Oncorhynchus masou masou]|uniref:gamma-tubulin complex component 4-like n=1 Tax=Oncorhynchus masou masou TaxID=90313 RepID=UPI0031845478
MIHELLLALSGYPGTIFTWNKRTGLQVSQDLPFLHPSETSVLNRLCKLGSDYIRFTEFIEQHTGHVHQQEHHSIQTNQAGLNGVYLRAFCTGLDSMLQPYRQALLDLEQEFQLLFPSVMVVVETIKSQKIHGCLILETVYKHSCGGLPLFAWPWRRQHNIKDLFCLSTQDPGGVPRGDVQAAGGGMLYGLLLDQSEEFWKQGPSAGGAAANQEEDEKTWGLGGLSGKQLKELQTWLIEEENMLAPSLQQFSLRAEMLPSYVPIRVAEKILFVGESVQMFENHNHSPSRAGSILKHQEDMFATELHRLKQQPLFSLVDFENLIDGIRSTVAEIIKDFYLLGRGELYQVFIDHAQHMLKTPPTAVTEHDVNVAFQQAAHKVLLDDDNLLPLLHLTIDYQGRRAKVCSSEWLFIGAETYEESRRSNYATGTREGATPTQESSPREVLPYGWAALGLAYKVQWPLHILFTPAALEKWSIAQQV